MDFSLDETQQAVQQVAAEVLRRERARPGHDEALVPGSAVGDVPSFDETAWKALAQAGMLSLTLPPRLGGEGLGLLEASLVLREIGRHVAPVPAAATFAGMLFVSRHADRQQQDRWLEGVGSGDALLTCATTAGPSPLRARRTEHGWRLDGRLTGVAHAQAADRVLVPALVDGDAAQPVVAVVAPSGTGVSLRPGYTSAHREEATVVLDAAVVPDHDVVADGEAAGDLHRLLLAGSCAVADGVLAGALELTAEHVRTREQFGRPLATFQAVAGQAADVYVAARTVHLATRRACWRLHHRLDADQEIAVAAYWACTHAPAAMQTCHHLHGGAGVDASYPLHRHYGWVKDTVRLLGGSAGTLEVLGRRLRRDERPDEAPPEEGGMFLELTPQQRALRDELRGYFEGLVSPEERETMLTERHGRTYREVVRRMGHDGRLGVGWPTEYGGRGFSEVEQQIFVNEAARADVPLPAVTLQTVGPTLQEHGTREQREMFLPRILAGDVHFAIGYTEPDAGTDLAALRTTAVRDGDHYVVNGQKTFTTGAHDADYIWLAVRTDAAAPRHRGISILIVDTEAEGYGWSPIITCDGAHHVNATYFDDVRVPASMLVGEENGGWKLITTQLNHERVMLGPAGRLAGLLHRVVGWASAQHDGQGRPLLEVPAVRRVLAEAQACVTVNETLNWQVAASAAAGPVQVADASATKVFASEHVQRVGRLLEEVVGCYGDPAEPRTARLLRWLDVQARRNLVLTFGGGVNEIQRELIAQTGLGLPRVPR
ncbi:MAG: acyl-CoA dehydrogenase [Actinomycetota bacterium]|nr:acyl-CoA dehydrogenase [Actinomycetota bacterium]